MRWESRIGVPIPLGTVSFPGRRDTHTHRTEDQTDTERDDIQRQDDRQFSECLSPGVPRRLPTTRTESLDPGEGRLCV